ncbi:MAG: hypothetical protein KDD53_04695 [Bdellovibrionales bacterium]|nr:hypothetical protein [Bdellovibrionales bacterium]
MLAAVPSQPQRNDSVQAIARLLSQLDPSIVTRMSNSRSRAPGHPYFLGEPDAGTPTDADNTAQRLFDASPLDALLCISKVLRDAARSPILFKDVDIDSLRTTLARVTDLLLKNVYRDEQESMRNALLAYHTNPNSPFIDLQRYTTIGAEVILAAAEDRDVDFRWIPQDFMLGINNIADLDINNQGNLYLRGATPTRPEAPSEIEGLYRNISRQLGFDGEDREKAYIYYMTLQSPPTSHFAYGEERRDFVYRQVRDLCIELSVPCLILNQGSPNAAEARREEFRMALLVREIYFPFAN